MRNDPNNDPWRAAAEDNDYSHPAETLFMLAVATIVVVILAAVLG